MADKNVKKSGMHGSDTYVTFPKNRRQTTVKVLGNNFQEKYTPYGLTNNQALVLWQFHHTQVVKKNWPVEPIMLWKCTAVYIFENYIFFSYRIWGRK